MSLRIKVENGVSFDMNPDLWEVNVLLCDPDFLLKDAHKIFVILNVHDKCGQEVGLYQNH